MALSSRIIKLENSVPAPAGPKPDLSKLSIEELKFLEQCMKSSEPLLPDSQQKFDMIGEKITWIEV